MLTRFVVPGHSAEECRATAAAHSLNGSKRSVLGTLFNDRAGHRPHKELAQHRPAIGTHDK